MKKLLTILLFILVTSSLSANMTVRLDRLYCLTSGELVELPILLENSYPSYLLGGYDFIIEYDTRLIFSQVLPGDLINGCGWEYFNYSTPSSNSIRIVAIAEINNGPIHPSCYADSSGTLAFLKFQITPNIIYLDEFLPVWWSWGDCGDNSISSSDGNQLYISDSVYSFNGINEYNITQESSFPTLGGAPNECVAGSSPTPIRNIDFYSGGLDISPTGFQVHCPSNIVSPSDSGTCGAVIFFEIPLNSECQGVTSVSSPPSGSFFPIGNNEVTTIAYDYLGHIDSCKFNIIIEDSDRPQIFDCQTDTTLYTEPGEWWTILEYNFNASDNCSSVTLSSSDPSGSYFAIGITDVYCVATDSYGNADTSVFSVTVIDNEPPVLLCPDTIFLQTENAQCGATVDFTIVATDNSRQVTVTKSIESGSFLPIGITRIDINASDPYGNSDSCSFVVIVEDNEPPIIECISTITVPNQMGQCGAFVSYDLSVTDNCGDVHVDYSIPSYDYFPVGSTTVYVTATDSSQNVDSCQFTVVVQDIQYPDIAFLGDITQSTDPNLCGAVVDFYYYISENCDGYTLTTTGNPGSFYEVGSTLVVGTITDRAGHSASDSMNVFIVDNQPPVIENIDDIMVLSDSGYYGAVVNYAPLVSDNCQLNSVVIEPQSGTYFEIGTHEVSVSATDIHGNFDSVIFIVNVVLQDIDNDMVADFEDNCLSVYNPEQEDFNNDSVGDACCCVGLRGNIDESDENPPNDIGVDISDLVLLVEFMFETNTGIVLSCPAEADFDASGEIDISDLVFLVAFMFESSANKPFPCQ